MTALNLGVIPAKPTGPREARPDDRLRAEPGSIPRDLSIESDGGCPSQNEGLGLWVPAFAGTTVNHRQCNSRASNRLISLPTASPNSERITTPARS